MDERTAGQLRVIKAVADALGAVDIPAWLFGGWGLDARIDRITREHGDIEFWVERVDAERSKAVLVAAGAEALATQPPEESCEFVWDGVDFSTAYFDRQPDGAFSQPEGRWSDWLFPPGSFGDEPGTLNGMSLLTMSVAGMLAMKEQYPSLRNGRPWRPKDIEDLKVLRRLLAEADSQVYAADDLQGSEGATLQSDDATFQAAVQAAQANLPPAGVPGLRAAYSAALTDYNAAATDLENAVIAANAGEDTEAAADANVGTTQLNSANTDLAAATTDVTNYTSS